MKTNSLSILCVISYLQDGGAERVMTWLSQGLARRGNAVVLACFEDGRRPPTYGAPDGVDLRYLDLHSLSRNPAAALEANARRLRRLRDLYREVDPEVIVSFVDRTNVLAIAAGLGLGRPIVVSERVDPRSVDIGRHWRWARRRLYAQCSRLVLQAEDVRPFFASSLQSRIRVIPNPVLVPEMGAVRARASPRKLVLGVGRLNRQKGFDLLIGAFHRISDSFPEWDLTILGEGAERANLEALVARLGLGQRVRMPGREADPFPYYRGADVFVLSSRFEGFPGVLVEAMGMGAPVIAAACTGAVTEILEGGRSGLLVEPNSTASLALALERLMGDSAERARLADAGRSVRQRYAPDRILDQWEELFRELVSNP